MTAPIPAAGTVPWRRRDGRLEVALVHRPKYDDWSWAKGKLDPGEEPCVAAVRETLEETGLLVRLGMPLPMARYPLVGPRGRRATKEVHYWAAEVVGGSGILEHEIDEVAWVDVKEAHERLDYTRDRDQLRALVRADRSGALETWPLALVRHARAMPRSRWKTDDRLRPLDAAGQRQALALVPVLGTYGLTRLVTSSSVRCAETLAPYAKKADVRLREHDSLSEEGYAEDPTKARRRLEKVLRRGEPAAVCSHGPVLPDLLAVLRDRVDPDGPHHERTLAELSTSVEENLAKGEVVVAHLVGTGKKARVVAVERTLA